jgi:carbon storage regulator CsrA
MLILSRKKSESVIIRTPSGEVIKVMVVETGIAGTHSGGAKLGFTADRSIQIHREEVDTIIQETKRQRDVNRKDSACLPCNG